MFTLPWTTIFTVGLQLVGFFLSRTSASDETKKLFWEFVKKAGSDLTSEKLLAYGDKQLEYLKSHPWKESE